MQSAQNISHYQTKTHNGMALRIPGDPRKDAFLNRIVTIKNRGDRAVKWEFGGELYCLRAKAQWDRLCVVACHILGDPDQRPGAVNGPERGTVKTWAQQVADLQNMWGTHKHERVMHPGPGQELWRFVVDPDSMWQYIMDGHLYVDAKELGFGRGKDYYTPPTADYVRPVFEGGDPLQDDMETRVRHGYAQGKRMEVGGSPLEDDEDEADKFVPAAKKKQGGAS
jgi:hypothetical protein